MLVVVSLSGSMFWNHSHSSWPCRLTYIHLSDPKVMFDEQPNTLSETDVHSQQPPRMFDETTGTSLILRKMLACDVKNPNNMIQNTCSHYVWCSETVPTRHLFLQCQPFFRGFMLDPHLDWWSLFRRLDLHVLSKLSPKTSYTRQKKKFNK